jgi:hypothetical protein
MAKNSLASSKLFDPAPRIGRCIYCGATETRLTDEHIFAYGLEGKWKLREASCDECAKITSSIEHDVLRGMLLAPRTALGMATRRKKERPTELPISVDRGSGLEEILVPPEDHPALAIFPRFLPPACLSGAKYVKGITFNATVPMAGGRLSLTDFAEKYGATRVDVKNTYEPTSLARMLAKIAYAYCVGRFGLSAFEKVYVLPAILGHADDVGMWVGCIAEYSVASHPEHVIRTDLIDGDLVAHIRLFGDRAPIEYVVVVGRLVTSATVGDLTRSDTERVGHSWLVKLALRLEKAIKRLA